MKKPSMKMPGKKTAGTSAPNKKGKTRTKYAGGGKVKKMAGYQHGGSAKAVAGAKAKPAVGRPKMKVGVAAGPRGKVGVGARGRGSTTTSGAR